MNQTQIKYAIGRLEIIYREKVRVIHDKYRVLPMTSEQKVKALSEGRYTIDSNINPHVGGWSKAIVFLDEQVENTKEKDNALNSLKLNYTKIKDELVLGDNEVALKMIKDFENV